ncbi:MAG TPA: glycosyltransferase family 4 protein [Candidatus Dormibacteraeota bacterium]|jgi:colanic acid biosynthesis glycosyl transferase WcaI|nr:glycosyltransferase family 4 protein [Candidatus Dormibacteraeota bacterium]
MRFLILTQYFPPEIGGAQTRLKSFASELVRRGHDVEVVTAMPNYPRGKFFEGYEKGWYKREDLEGITVHRVWLYPAVGGGLKRMLNYTSFTAMSFYGLCRAQKPDYIFVESPPLFLSFPAFLAGLVWRVPFIFNVADLWPDVIVDGGFMKEGIVITCLRKIEKWSYRRAAFVNAVTDWIFKLLQERKSVPLQKLLFLPNGVDTQKFRPAPPDSDLREQLGLSGKNIVLWAGTLGFAHGLENVLLAAKLLEGESDLHFLFVGDGSARVGLQQMHQQLKLKNVTFRDPVPLDSVPAYFSIALCGLASLVDIPTYEGARPSKLFPVLASGKPLIFVGKGEAAQLVERAQAGIVVPPGDPQCLADAFLRLARNPELAAELGQNGRRFVENNLQWSKLVGEWLRQLTSDRIAEQPVAADVSKVSL